ncbi:hypothetical protein IWX90DRAFT_506218 [Phyllosticta citrichinensis]|uniref:Chitin-binding type-1 domain-containing protein n=1 Tax=Phyllosticta citrichinensis TaxID=1130410 RepID=A0ABR1XNA7_9PEZI
MGGFWDSSFRTRFHHLLLFLSPILVSADPIPARAPGPSYSPSRLPQSYSSTYVPAASRPTSCPGQNGSIITGSSGYHYQILCNYGMTAYEGFYPQMNDFTDVSQCANQCDLYDDCTGATWGANTFCYLKTQIIYTVRNPAGTNGDNQIVCLDCPQSQCPRDDRTLQVRNGSTWGLICGFQTQSTNINGDAQEASVVNFDQCLDRCTTNPGCLDAHMQSDGCHLKSGFGQRITNNMGEGSWWNLDSPAMAQHRSLFPRYTPTGAAASMSPLPPSTTSRGSPTSRAGASTTAAPVQSPSGTPSYAPAPENPSCPVANNTVYTNPNTGSRFLIQCGIDARGTDMGGPRFATTAQWITESAQTCDTTAGCIWASVSGPAAYLKSSIDSLFSEPNIVGLRKLSTGTGPVRSSPAASTPNTSPTAVVTPTTTASPSAVASSPSGRNPSNSATGTGPSASYAPAGNDPSCPTANNTVYTVPSTGSTYLITCGVDAAGLNTPGTNPRRATTAQWIADLIRQCDNTALCNWISVSGNGGYFKQTVERTFSEPNIAGVRKLAAGTGSANTANTSPTGTIAPGAMSTPTSTLGASTPPSSTGASSTRRNPVASTTGANPSASYPPAGSDPSCPSANNTVYTVPNTGSKFLIQCGLDARGTDIGGPRFATTAQWLAESAQTCDSTASCIWASVSGPAAYLKSTIDSTFSEPNIAGLRKLYTGTGTGGTSGGASPPPASTPTAASTPAASTPSNPPPATTTPSTAPPAPSSTVQTGTAPSSTPSYPVCPSANNTVYTVPGTGSRFFIQCGIDAQGVDIPPAPRFAQGVSSSDEWIANLIGQCDAVGNCYWVSISGSAGYLKSSISSTFSEPNIVGARKLSPGEVVPTAPAPSNSVPSSRSGPSQATGSTNRGATTPSSPASTPSTGSTNPPGQSTPTSTTPQSPSTGTGGAPSSTGTSGASQYPTCPTANDTTYTAASGSQWYIICGIDARGVDIPPSPRFAQGVSSTDEWIANLIGQCDTTTDCNWLSVSGPAGYFKSSISSTFSEPNIVGIQRIGAGTPSQSTSPAQTSSTGFPPGTCGPQAGNQNCANAPDGPCCSQYGYCGSSEQYCGAGCQLAFGTCFPPSSSSLTDGPSNSLSKASTPSTGTSAGTPSQSTSPAQTSSTGFPPGTCGPQAGNQNCANAPDGPCCSQYGYCGSSELYCGAGCQLAFGTCFPPSSSSLTDGPSNSLSEASTPSTGASTNAQSPSTGSPSDTSTPSTGSTTNTQSPTAPTGASTTTGAPSGASTPTGGSTTNAQTPTGAPSSSTSSSPPVASNPTCPSANDTTYTAASGSQWYILCGIDSQGTELSGNPRFAEGVSSTDEWISNLISQCDATNNCNWLSVSGSAGYFKSAVFSLFSEPNIVGIRRLDTGGNTGTGTTNTAPTNTAPTNTARTNTAPTSPSNTTPTNTARTNTAPTSPSNTAPTNTARTNTAPTSPSNTTPTNTARTNTAPTSPSNTAPSNTARTNTAPMSPSNTTPTNTARTNTAPTSPSNTAPSNTARTNTAPMSPSNTTPTNTARTNTAPTSPSNTAPSNTARTNTAPMSPSNTAPTNTARTNTAPTSPSSNTAPTGPKNTAPTSPSNTTSTNTARTNTAPTSPSNTAPTNTARTNTAPTSSSNTAPTGPTNTAPRSPSSNTTPTGPSKTTPTVPTGPSNTAPTSPSNTTPTAPSKTSPTSPSNTTPTGTSNTGSPSNTARTNTGSASNTAGTNTGSTSKTAGTNTGSSTPSTSNSMGSSTVSPPAASSTPSCPSANGTIYTVPATGTKWYILCGIDSQGSEMPGNPRWATTADWIGDNIKGCDATPGCTWVSISGSAGYYKDLIVSTFSEPNIIGVRKVVGRVSSSSTGQSSTQPPSVVQPTGTPSPSNSASSPSASGSSTVSGSSSASSGGATIPAPSSPSSGTDTSVPTTSGPSTVTVAPTTSSIPTSSSATGLSSTVSQSASSTTSYVASPSNPTCPSANGTVYTVPSSGSTYFIQCGIDAQGTDIPPSPRFAEGVVSSDEWIANLIGQCDNQVGCNWVSASGPAGYLKASVDRTFSEPNIVGIRKLSAGTGASSSSSLSQSSPTPSSTTGGASTLPPTSPSSSATGSEVLSSSSSSASPSGFPLGSCGPAYGGNTCFDAYSGPCCSSSGYCGRDPEYCGAGCQDEYGLCGLAASSAISSSAATGSSTVASSRGVPSTAEIATESSVPSSSAPSTAPPSSALSTSSVLTPGVSSSSTLTGTSSLPSSQPSPPGTGSTLATSSSVPISSPSSTLPSQSTGTGLSSTGSPSSTLPSQSTGTGFSSTGSPSSTLPSQSTGTGLSSTASSSVPTLPSQSTGTGFSPTASSSVPTLPSQSTGTGFSSTASSVVPTSPSTSGGSSELPSSSPSATLPSQTTGTGFSSTGATSVPTSQSTGSGSSELSSSSVPTFSGVPASSTVFGNSTGTASQSASGTVPATSASFSAAPTNPTCPSANNTVYTASSGGSYLIQCGIDAQGQDLANQPVWAMTADWVGELINRCDQTADCNWVSISGSAGYMKSSVTRTFSEPNIIGVRKLFAGPGAQSSSGLSSTTSSSLGQTGSVSSSLPSSSNTGVPVITPTVTGSSTISQSPSSTASYAVAPTNPTCPSANNTVYTPPGADSTFLIQCGIDAQGQELAGNPRWANVATTDMWVADLIDQCSATPDCVWVSVSGSAGYLKSNVNNLFSEPNIIGRHDIQLFANEYSWIVIDLDCDWRRQLLELEHRTKHLSELDSCVKHPELYWKHL